MKGVYLYGGVGSGKSMLMDMLFEVVTFLILKAICLKFYVLLDQACESETTASRVHFHAFMLGVHQRQRKYKILMSEP